MHPCPNLNGILAKPPFNLGHGWVMHLVVLLKYNHIYPYFNTWRPRQNGRNFPDDIFKCIFLNENVWISIKITLNFDPKGPINNIPALVEIIAWRRPGDKPLSQPMSEELYYFECSYFFPLVLFPEQSPSLNQHCTSVVDVCIRVYNEIKAQLLPTPAKSHYTFNLRDLSKVFQGILMADPTKIEVSLHDGIITWTYFTHYWPCMIGESTRHQRFPLIMGQWCRALMFSLLLTWISFWPNLSRWVSITFTWFT